MQKWRSVYQADRVRAAINMIDWDHWLVKWRVEFRGREWNFVDIATLTSLAYLHFLSLLAPFYFTWTAFWLAIALYFVSGIGVTVSFHRNLSHRSFKLPRWLEYFFAYCGVLSLQRSPLDWVSVHRSHHQYTDTVKDPHSPVRGFWFSHVGWALDYRGRNGSYDARLKNVNDLKRQPYYIFLHYTYPLHYTALGVLLYFVGGMPFLVWGMGVRTVIYLHATFALNSVCHKWGHHAWEIGDLSTNNWFIALLAHGEGWHNNHHAFPHSARHGLEWWQIDVTWYVIRFLELVGLATDVKLPTETQKKQRTLSCRMIDEGKQQLDAKDFQNGKL